mmetsp:Transcript_6727/g.11584  ORF Transcript_6727/g.11584 Transcript_6727/m.11584 type:complete len:389 (-) Transcript_6727:75-1241(-)
MASSDSYRAEVRLPEEDSDYDESEEEGDEDFLDDEYEMTTSLLEQLAEDPPKPDERWKKGIGKLDDLLKRRHGNVLKLCWHPVKGRVLHSRRAFKPGQQIISDRALAIVTAPTEDDGNELWERLRRVCEERELALDPVWYWTALNTACPVIDRTPKPESIPKQHKLTGEDDDTADPENVLDPEVWLSPLSAAVGKRLDMLYTPEVEEPSLEVMTVLHELKLDKLLDPFIVEKRLMTAVQNCFQCTDDRERSGLGMWFTPSFLSHSCIPNAVGAVDSNGIFNIMAQRAIKPGDEVTISYIGDEDLTYNAAYRRMTLAKSRHFICQCPRCAGDDALRPCACFICGQILLYMQTGEEVKRSSFCKRLATQGVVNTYVWSHMAVCALSGGNV